MNLIFLAFVSISFAFAAQRHINWVPTAGEIAPMDALSKAMIESATGSVELAMGLIGVMTLFLGLIKIAEAGGLLNILARLIRPLMVKLFPDVPPDHPAMGAMILNLSANALGLGNAATPFGIRAMQELDKLNSRPGTSTDAMALFLAINTSSVTLLPTGVIALRASAGSVDPSGILPTTLFATFCSTLIAIVAAKLYSRLARRSRPPAIQADIKSEQKASGQDSLLANLDPNTHLSDDICPEAYPFWVSIAAISALIAAIPLAVVYGQAVSSWVVPGLMVGFLAFGVTRKVRIYEVFVEGAKEGFQVAIKIIPYLVAILVAVGMLRASGAMEVMVKTLGPLTQRVGIPAEALPMVLMRPLSGSGAYGILASIINDPAIGPDSYTGYLVSTIQGSTETTFYVLAVYFGAVQVKRMRHSLAAALTGEIAGLAGSIVACTYLYCF